MSGKDINRILELEDRSKHEQLDALNWIIIGKAPLSTGEGFFYKWDHIPYYEQFFNKEKMYKTQMHKANILRYNCIGRVPSLKVELGDFMATMFGAEIKVKKDQLSPWIMPLDYSLKDLVAKGIPSLKYGIFPKVVEYYEYFVKNIHNHYYMDCPGLCSPFTEATELMGTKIYYELYDNPDMVNELLDIILNLTFSVYDLLFEIMGINNFSETIWMSHYINGLHVAGDPVIGLKDEMIKEFEIPYLKKIAQHYNTKIFYHYCDKPFATRKNYNFRPIDLMIGEEVCGLNQVGSGYWYYLDNYKKLRKNKVAINTYLNNIDADDSSGPVSYEVNRARDYTKKELYKWLNQMYEETYGKSGIHLILRNILALNLENQKIVKEIWESF